MCDSSAPAFPLFLLKWQKSDVHCCRAKPGQRTVVPPRLRGLRGASGGSGRAPSVVRWKSPCSCRPTAAISAMFLLKISTSFALNLARDRVKQKIQLEGSGGGSLSLHGWALNTCNSDTSVSCGSESCFLFVALQMLHLWEKNKNSFPLEWLLGRRLQRLEEYTCHDRC